MAQAWPIYSRFHIEYYQSLIPALPSLEILVSRIITISSCSGVIGLNQGFILLHQEAPDLTHFFHSAISHYAFLFSICDAYTSRNSTQPKLFFFFSLKTFFLSSVEVFPQPSLVPPVVFDQLFSPRFFNSLSLFCSFRWEFFLRKRILSWTLPRPLSLHILRSCLFFPPPPCPAPVTSVFEGGRIFFLSSYYYCQVILKTSPFGTLFTYLIFCYPHTCGT